MNSRERVLAALERKPVDRVPFVETTIGLKIGEALLGHPRPTLTIPALRSTIRNVEDEKALSRLLHRDNISLRITAPIFSAIVRGATGEVFAEEGLIHTMDDFKKHFRLPDPDDETLYEPVRTYVKEREEFAVIFSTRIAFLSAVMSIGFQTFMEAIYLDPELVDAVMTAYVKWSARVLERVCEIGVDVVKSTDDFAFHTGPFISPEAFRRWVVSYHQVAAQSISVPWIAHSDGDILPIVEDMLAMGIKGIHPIDPNCMDIRAFKRQYGHRICILGNVDVNTLAMGTPEATYEEVRDLIRDLAPGYGYIVSSGNSIPDYVVPENMLAFAKAVRDFGAYHS
jgi:uroporphyrinogen decarboxylase